MFKFRDPYVAQKFCFETPKPHARILHSSKGQVHTDSCSPRLSQSTGKLLQTSAERRGRPKPERRLCYASLLAMLPRLPKPLGRTDGEYLREANPHYGNQKRQKTNWAYHNQRLRPVAETAAIRYGPAHLSRSSLGSALLDAARSGPTHAPIQIH